MTALLRRIGRKIQMPMAFLRRQVHARPFAVGAVCFLAGILIAQKLPLLGWLILLIAALIASCIRRCVRFRSALILLMVFALGGLRMQIAQMASPVLRDSYSVNFTGVVISDPVVDVEKERIICTLRLKSVSGEKQNADVRLYLRGETFLTEKIEYGQELECFGHIWLPEEPTNPYQFNQNNWLKSLGTSAMAAAKLENVTVTPPANSLGKIVSQIRFKISERIDLLFERNSDLVRAFVLGDRTNLADSLTDSFRDAGITHLICISGMHVSVLAMAVSLLLGSFMRRRTATVVTIVLVFLYGAMIGFPPSLLRAAIMFAFFSIATLIGRPSDGVTRIAIALVGMLLIEPFYILNAGFVLSFGATAGLILLDSPMEALLGIDSWKHRVPDARFSRRMLQKLAMYFPQLLAATLAAQIAILPAVVDYFGMQSPISVPANLLAVPLAMVAYPLAMAALLLSTISVSLGQLFAQIPDRMFSWLVSLAGFLAERASEGIQVPNYPTWLIFIHVALCIAASDLTRIRMSIRKFLPIAISALLGISVLIGFWHSLGFGAVFLDAGQADAAVLHAGGHVYMIDTGDSYTPAADYVSATCVHLDAIFLSHPHKDHAAGLLKVLSEIRPDAIYIPEGWEDYEADEEVAEAMALAEKMNIPIHVLHGGDTLSLPGNLTLTVTAPNAMSTSGNDCSQLLAFTCRNRTMLFTGDLTRRGEPSDMPNADVLKVPHHGSGKSCSSQMLNAVDPQIAVISVGRDNAYGHPASKTLERLGKTDCAVYRTDQNGAISVMVHPNGNLSVKTFLPAEESK